MEFGRFIDLQIYSSKSKDRSKPFIKQALRLALVSSLLLTGCTSNKSKYANIFPNPTPITVPAETPQPEDEASEQAESESTQTESEPEAPKITLLNAHQPEKSYNPWIGTIITQQDSPVYDSKGILSNCGPVAIGNALNRIGFNVSTAEMVAMASTNWWAWNKERGYTAELLPEVINAKYGDKVTAEHRIFTNSEQIKSAIEETKAPIWLSIQYDLNTDIATYNSGLGHAVTILHVGETEALYTSSLEKRIKTITNRQLDKAIPLNGGEVILFHRK
jgi:hypothetical protein